ADPASPLPLLTPTLTDQPPAPPAGSPNAPREAMPRTADTRPADPASPLPHLTPTLPDQPPAPPAGSLNGPVGTEAKSQASKSPTNITSVPLPSPPALMLADPNRSALIDFDDLQSIRSRLQAIENAGRLSFPAPAEAFLTNQLVQPALPTLPHTGETIVELANAAPPEFASSKWIGHALPLTEGVQTSESLPLALPHGSVGSLLPAAGLTTAGPPISTSLAAPLASPEWQRGLSQHLIGLQQRGEQEIELHLHPAELGPLSISLKLGEAGAQAQFLSAHPQVRAAVEQAIPQLREALAEQGITLGETSVGERQHQPQGERSGDSGGSGALAGGAGEEAAPGQVEAAAPRPVRLEGVDLYA
ncbi:flagellar hook-length control protein FliK, partial [Azotobacter salinestris]